MSVTVSLEQFFAQLVRDFLHENRAQVTLPAAAALPFVTAFESGDRVKPCVATNVEQIETPSNRRLIKIPVHVAVLVNHTDTTEADERGWKYQLRLLLGNTALWKAWLAAKSEADRTGWQILGYRISQGSTSFDAETEHREITTLITFWVHSEELQQQ